MIGYQGGKKEKLKLVGSRSSFLGERCAEEKVGKEFLITLAYRRLFLSVLEKERVGKKEQTMCVFKLFLSLSFTQADALSPTMPSINYLGRKQRSAPSHE